MIYLDLPVTEQVLNIPGFHLEHINEGSSWKSSIAIDNNSNKQYFKDLIITIEGSFIEDNIGFNPCPEEILTYTKGKQSLDFSIKQKFTYNGTQYVKSGKPEIKVSNIVNLKEGEPDEDTVTKEDVN